MAIAEVAIKETGFALRTSVEVSAAELTAAGFAASHLICSIIYLERTGKKISQSLTGGELAAEQKTNGSIRQAAFYAFWNGTSAQKITWEGSESSGSNLTLQAFSGVDTTTPVDVAAAWGTFASTASPVAPTVTTVTNGAWQGCYVAPTSAAVLKEATTGFTKYGNFLLGRELPTAGASGTTTLKLNEAASGITLTFALRPKATGKTVEGQALLSGTGSLSAVPTRTVFGKAELAGHGSIEARATATHLGSAHLEGKGSLSAVPSRTALGQADLQGVGSLSARATQTQMGRATLQGAGSLEAKGVRTRFGQALLAGLGSLIAGGVAEHKGSASGQPRRPFGRRYKSHNPPE